MAPSAAPAVQGEEGVRSNILQPDTVRRFKRLNLAARLMVRGFFQGLNPSMLKGCSLDFSDLREYSPGDDPRLLDWKAYARTDKLFVRQFEVERDASIMFLLDASPSMSFSSGAITKFEYSKYLIAALSFIGSGQHDRVGLLVSPGGKGAFLPTRRGRSHLNRVLRHLDSATTNPGTGPFSVFRDHIAKLKRRAIVVVASDLLDEDAEIASFLRRAAFGGHTVIVFHVLDRAEKELTFSGTVDFQDMESSKHQTVRIDERFRDRYRGELLKYCDNMRAQCSRLGIEHVLVDTATPYDVALITFLMRRRHARGSKIRSGNSRWIRYM